MDLPPAERILADAVAYLISKGEREVARALLKCSLSFYQIDKSNVTQEWEEYAVVATLKGPEDVTEFLGGHYFEPNPHRPVVLSALQAVVPFECHVHLVSAWPGVNIFDPTWREQLLEKTYTSTADNQGIEEFNDRIVVWNALRFRSESERRIAAALDAAGVMFLPNCRARLGPSGKRQNREGDFLICHEGKWGLLEVDGEPFHPPLRKAQEDERDRLFKQHGVRVVEHFDATRCYDAPLMLSSSFSQS